MSVGQEQAMKITNHAVGSPAVTPQQPAQDVSPVADPSVEAAVRATKAYTPSAELQRLLELVRAEPAIRSDRVAEIALRLQQGDYLSAITDEKVAESMLNERTY
jgi:anti-sigma28 factor (negative regulator of flagellin synthesis)